MNVAQGAMSATAAASPSWLGRQLIKMGQSDCLSRWQSRTLTIEPKWEKLGGLPLLAAALQRPCRPVISMG